MAVKLTAEDPRGSAEFADLLNVSARGARIVSKQPRDSNEFVVLTPSGGGDATRARVVYCQALPNAEYAIGLEFCEPTGSQHF